MLEKAKTRPDLFLLLSVLLIILIYPVLDHGAFRRLILAGLMFEVVILATVRLSQVRTWMWPSVSLMSGVLIFGLANTIWPSRTLDGIRWGVLTLFFGLTVAGLFSYLKKVRVVSDLHLYTAVSIYLLLGMQWFALYSAIEDFYPDAILHNNATLTNRHSDLLYFSLVTLSTIGYGDIVPLNGVVRMLAALEGVAGVLYVAITVALLVSAYKQNSTSS
jgi:hypothetical protein